VVLYEECVGGGGVVVVVCGIRSVEYFVTRFLFLLFCYWKKEMGKMKIKDKTSLLYDNKEFPSVRIKLDGVVQITMTLHHLFQFLSKKQQGQKKREKWKRFDNTGE
jgi:hypothetical protein